MNNIKLKEALALYSLYHDGKSCEKELRQALYPNASDVNQKQALRALKYGRTERITPDMVWKICEITGFNPNRLFGWIEL